MTDAVVTLRGVVLGYGGRPAVEGIDLTISRGEAIALVGPNGAGKSTVLKGVLGLLHPMAGTIEWRDPADADRVGYLPQADSIDPDFPITLAQVVRMGRYRTLGWWRPMRAADRAAVARALDRVGLAHLAGTRFGDLSGGQRQRALLARALAADPRILLLDEPFNGLDQPSRDALVATLGELKRDGVAVLVSTHDVEFARAVCDRALLIAHRPVALGPVDEVLVPENLVDLLAGSHDVHGDRSVEPRSGLADPA